MRDIQMDLIRINDRISYIETTDDPLCADIGIIKAGDETWLFDVGNGEKNVADLKDDYNIVLSHFHADHVGNLDKVSAKSLYVSNETFKHVGRGTIVREDVTVGDIHIFPLPSSHVKGGLGLEVDETYAFVGDGLYSKVKDGFYIYNSQMVKEEIDVLEKLKAPFLLVSHLKGLVREKADAIEELKKIYSFRDKNSSEIRIPMV